MSTSSIIFLVAVVIGIVLIVVGIIIGVNTEEQWVTSCGFSMALFVIIGGFFLSFIFANYEQNEKMFNAWKNSIETATTEEDTTPIKENDCLCEECNKGCDADYKFCPECGAELKKAIGE